ncbi:glycosyltransferase family 2 protein [Roseovarius sp. CAU 1744]|uniref:glycosyltransferase family 2 protein n=1 Tax=Roseovarius sp. CAU 1744 TaxID=3140368 RepID=UPI00325B17B4
MTGKLIERRLISHGLDDLSILDAVEKRELGQRYVTLFFDSDVPTETVVPPTGAKLAAASTLGGASCLTYELPEKYENKFEIAGQPINLAPANEEFSLMEGCNALAAVRNGESAEIVLDWLAYHTAHQNADAAVILDRAKPGTGKKFVNRLRKGLRIRDLRCNVVVLRCDLPLGRQDLPAEAHPFCVPEAPGKDRMTVPDPAPWKSPLGALSIYEIMRARFLGRARAVANIDVHDLVPPGETTIFDSAISAEGGLIGLVGQHCYPWRIRKGEQVHFADHTCVQFDASGGRQRWCIAPSKSPEDAIWRLVRVGNAEPDVTRTRKFFRHMALRHPTPTISKIVPKTSLIEHPPLLEQSTQHFGHNPVRMPEVQINMNSDKRGKCAIVTTMKNEGPFILEWLAYHRAIGVDDFLVYTNDCTDGTDTMLQLLQDKGFVQHRENPFRQSGLKPQHAALQAAEDEPVIRNATWLACIDVDEFINIKIGDGTLNALFAAVPDANMIAMTWRLFGNSNVHEFQDCPITEQFLLCAPELIRKPHQAWGFKTLFRNVGLFKKLGVHRPKGLKPQLWKKIYWVNGSGQRLPRDIYRNGWRSTTETYGYDLVQLNHYAVRSAESFLVKRDRGRVNHVDRDQGLAYWFRMNNNAETETSIQCRLAKMHEELARLMSDPDIATTHHHAVARHREKIDKLRATKNYANFFAELTGSRLEKLSRLHEHFGANVFLAGPNSLPDDVVDRDPDAEWFVTVERLGETKH